MNEKSEALGLPKGASEVLEHIKIADAAVAVIIETNDDLAIEWALDKLACGYWERGNGSWWDTANFTMRKKR